VQNPDPDEYIYKIPDFMADKRQALSKLKIVSIVCICFMTAEFLGGYFANSLAILSDAAHLLSDVSGFFISILSIYLTQIPSNFKMSYGYHRAEIVGALASVLLIWGLTFWLVVEAVYRVINPPKIDAEIMLITSCMALGFNMVMFKILHSGGHGHCHHGHSHGDEHDDEPAHVQVIVD
jgi:zinc transporter 2